MAEEPKVISIEPYLGPQKIGNVFNRLLAKFLYRAANNPDSDVTMEDYENYMKTGKLNFASGGIVQYFQEGTGEEGVTADQGPISGFDVKPFIPPGARFDEDPLTLGDIGTGISETAETMWPYLVPGVGEHLSHKDYLQFSSEAEQALAEGKYPRWLGMTILGTVALGGTYPNWTVVGAVPNLALGIYKGAKKALTSPKKITQKPVVEMEKRFIVKDNQNKSVEWKQTKEEADEVASKLSAAEGTEFKVIETQVPIHMPAKIKKKKPEKKTIDVTPEMVIGTGNNRTYYSKLDEILTNPTGNMRVKTGGSGNVIDIPINEVSLTAKEWHNTLRMAGIKESELTDSYIRQYLNKIGKWDQAANDGRGAFTSNAKISYQEIKALADESPSRFLQTSTYSTRDGNLKYGSTGRSDGYKTDSAEEHVLWIDSKNIKGDTGKISEEIRQKTSSHRNMKEVETDVNFAAKNKLEGEPYIIGWSLVDERPGKIGNSNISVSTASEIQSDFLQMLQKKKNALKKDLQNTLQAGNTSPAEAIKKQLDTLIRPLGLSDLEVNKIVTALTKNQEIFSKAAKLNLDDMSPAVFKELDIAAKERDVILSQLNQNIDQMTLQQAFPNVPFKNQKEWVDAIIKNDLAIAAKKLFYFDENGVLKVNKGVPTHYAVSPSNVVKNRWMKSAMEENPDIGMSVPPNMRTSREHGQAVAYDMQYGGPNIKDHNGNLFRGNSEESLRRIASNKNATFSVGKVNFGGKFEDTYIIELTPEMLTPYVQYFKHGGLVEAIPYNPLRSVLDVLGPIGAY